MTDRNWLAPFERDFYDLRPSFVRLFNDLFPIKTGPVVDLHESPDYFELTAELPGADPEELDITVNEHSVTLKGEARRSNEREEDGYHLSERRYGAFMRTLPLPAEINPDGATARYHHGVLEIRLPKAVPDHQRNKKVRVSHDDHGTT